MFNHQMVRNMQLEDVIASIPTLAVDAVCISYQSEDDDRYRVVWVNESFCGMFATSAGAAAGMDPKGLLHEDYVADFVFALEEMRASESTSMSHDTLCLRCDGSSFWGGVSHVEIPDQCGTGSHAITFVRDIDNLKNREQSAELALIENEHLLTKIEAVQTRLMSAISMSPDPFAIFDARDRLVIWNPAFAENVSDKPDALVAGMTKHEIAETAVNSGFFDDAVGREVEYLKNYMADWDAGDASGFVMRVQGRDYKVIRAGAPNGDRVTLMVDVSEQLRQQRELRTYAERLELANEEISQQALHDELTGLGNRRFLKTCLDDLIAARKKTGAEIAALHIDLDRFKQINDTMGHAAGDHVLRAVAKILRTKVRKGDIVARIGGDEFIVLALCEADDDAPGHLADRLIREICKPIPFEDRPCRVGASIGIARTPTIPAHDLLTCSDIALYKAKTGGRATKATFDHADLENLKTAKRLSDDILRGIDAEEFVPVFQPQVESASGDIVAYEVLARWAHPSRGVLTPGEFLGAAREIQVDAKIDRMIFEKAIEECSGEFVGYCPAPTLSFNVCPTRLMEADLPEYVRNLDFPGAIAFELLETTFLEEEKASFFERISELREMGITFEVDDFGSGHASIVGLRRICPERLKIDQRLIQPIETSESAKRLVHSIIEIGRALGIGVTAEGVETEAQAELLKELGCDRMQGFYFARPEPLASALKSEWQWPAAAAAQA